MPLHLNLLTPDALTPSYLLTSARTFQHTVVDPTAPGDVTEALGAQPLDLILLTTLTPATAAAARALHLLTGAPVLAGESVGHAATGAHLPLARRLGDGEVVGLGPLAQTLAIPAPLDAEGAPDILAYAIGSANLLFTGPLFTRPIPRFRGTPVLPPLLLNLPADTLVLGGHAPNATPETAPTLGSLLAAAPKAAAPKAKVAAAPALRA